MALVDGVTLYPQPSGWNFLNLSTDDIYAGEEYALNAAAAASTAWPTAGLALYIPFYVSAPGLAVGIFWQNGAAVSGNVEAALYDEYGNKIATSGKIAQAGTSAPQYTAFAAPVQLTTGRYYIALMADNTTSTFLAWGTSLAATNVNRMFGILEQAGLSAGLPAAANSAQGAWTPVSSARSLMPICGVSFGPSSVAM